MYIIYVYIYIYPLLPIKDQTSPRKKRQIAT